MSRIPQKERILRHLRDFGSLNNGEAYTEYGIGHCASRISDLRKAGYDIRGDTVTSKNRYGEPTHFSRYTLGG